MEEFKEITPVNGFDPNDPNNAMQNNYAWSMADFGSYIYVGTGRNIALAALDSLGLQIPASLAPPGPIEYAGEIWRYNKNGKEDWERVYRSPEQLPNVGFRFMIVYKGAIYAAPYTFADTILLLKSTNGTDWEVLNTGIAGSNTRAMVIHKGKLYMGVLPNAAGGAIPNLLYVTEDPEAQGWTQVITTGNPNKNPRGGIATLISFNGQLYMGTTPPGGFELWRTTEGTPRTNEWKLVIDKGGGDALNEIPLTLGVFGNHLFVGTAILFAVESIDPAKNFVPPKGADLFRVHRNDEWEVIVGSEPIAPTNPTTGERNRGEYPSGLGDITNAYIWALREFNGRFYLGTFDWSDLLPPIICSLLTNNRGSLEKVLPVASDPELINSLAGEYNWAEWFEAVLRSLPSFPFTMGFDLYVSDNGVDWEPISLNGLGNPKNYGLRNFLVTKQNRLYVGTANPFQGCEVWVKEKEREVEDND